MNDKEQAGQFAVLLQRALPLTETLEEALEVVDAAMAMGSTEHPCSVELGMVGDEWHGPTAPGPGWVQVRVGERGGKVWKQQGGATAPQQVTPTPQASATKVDWREEYASAEQEWDRSALNLKYDAPIAQIYFAKDYAALQEMNRQADGQSGDPTTQAPLLKQVAMSASALASKIGQSPRNITVSEQSGFSEDDLANEVYSLRYVAAMAWRAFRAASGQQSARMSMDGVELGMVGDEWHGPQPPGEGWVQTGRGPRGGNIWKRPAKEAAQPGKAGKRFKTAKSLRLQAQQQEQNAEAFAVQVSQLAKSMQMGEGTRRSLENAIEWAGTQTGADNAAYALWELRDFGAEHPLLKALLGLRGSSSQAADWHKQAEQYERQGKIERDRPELARRKMLRATTEELDSIWEKLPVVGYLTAVDDAMNALIDAGGRATAQHYKSVAKAATAQTSRLSGQPEHADVVAALREMALKSLRAVQLSPKSAGASLGIDASFSFDIFNRKAQGILNKAMKAAKEMSAAARRDLKAAVKIDAPAEMAQAVVAFAEKYRSQLAGILGKTQLAALLAGAQEVASRTPPVPPQGVYQPPPPSLPPDAAQAILRKLEAMPEGERQKAVYDLPRDQQKYVRDALASGGTKSPIPPFAPPAPEDGELHFPVIEEAVRDLSERNLATRQEYDQMDAATRAKAFAVAGVDSRETLGKIRDALAENAREGADLETFREKVLADVEPSSFLSDGHLETLFRTNIQAAFSDGQMKVLSHPFVRSGFPYATYSAIDDDRVRHNHLALETLGIDGTAMYRIDDPVFKTFRPPWDFNDRCSWWPTTVEQAAHRGLAEAKKWLAEGVEPQPAAHVSMPPFRPPPGFARSLANAPLSIQMSMQSLDDFDDGRVMIEEFAYGTEPPGSGWEYAGEMKWVRWRRVHEECEEEEECEEPGPITIP